MKLKKKKHFKNEGEMNSRLRTISKILFLYRSNKNTVKNCQNQLFQNSRYYPNSCNNLESLDSRKLSESC